MLIKNDFGMIIEANGHIESHSHISGIEDYQLFQNLLRHLKLLVFVICLSQVEFGV